MTGVLRILLVDDEPPALARMMDLLRDLADDCPNEVIGTASNGPAALEWLQQHNADVALLDIQMPQMSGIELARHLPRLSHPPAVIFTTAYDQFALQAFDVHAIDYLLKPVRLDRLKSALERARKITPMQDGVLRDLAREPRRYFSVAERGRVRLVPVAEVLYLKAELKYVTLKTHDKEYLLEESLTHLEEELGDRFVRIHRNCLVARHALQGFEKVQPEDGEQQWVAVLAGLNEKLAVSRRQQHVIKQFRHG